jgi:hypothetical protein
MARLGKHPRVAPSPTYLKALNRNMRIGALSIANLLIVGPSEPYTKDRNSRIFEIRRVLTYRSFRIVINNEPHQIARFGKPPLLTRVSACRS